MSEELIGLREPIPTTFERDRISTRDRLRALGRISEIQVNIGGHKSIREPVVVKWKGDNPIGWWEIKDGRIDFVPFSSGELKVLATYSN